MIALLFEATGLLFVYNLFLLISLPLSKYAAMILY